MIGLMSRNNHPGLQLFTELLQIPSPSGREHALGELVASKIQALGYQTRTDPAGNVTVRVEGADPDAGMAVLAAHLDELAVLVTQVHADGTLGVNRSGALYPYKIGERPLTILGDHGQATGLLGFGSTHGGAGERIGHDWADLRITTGLAPQRLAELGIRPGSTAVPLPQHRGPHLMGDPDDPLVAAWTFDDRLGVAALIQLLERVSRQSITPPRPLCVAFTVHEEGGCHGAKVLAHREQPELFIAVDGCPIIPGRGIVNDGRPATWSKDAHGHLDQRLIAVFADAAARAGTSLQTAVFTEGAFSDASSVYNVGGAPRVGIIGHARQNSHGFELTPLSSFDNLLDTLTEFLKLRW